MWRIFRPLIRSIVPHISRSKNQFRRGLKRLRDDSVPFVAKKKLKVEVPEVSASSTFSTPAMIGDKSYRVGSDYRRLRRGVPVPVQMPSTNIWERQFAGRFTSDAGQQGTHVLCFNDTATVGDIHTAIRSYENRYYTGGGASSVQQDISRFAVGSDRVVMELHNFSDAPAHLDFYWVCAPKGVRDIRKNGDGTIATGRPVNVPPGNLENKSGDPWYQNTNIQDTPEFCFAQDTFTTQQYHPNPSHTTAATQYGNYTMERPGRTLYQIAGFRKDYRILWKKSYKMAPGGDLTMRYNLPAHAFNLDHKDQLYNGYQYKQYFDNQDPASAQYEEFGYLAGAYSRFLIVVVRGGLGAGQDAEGAETVPTYAPCKVLYNVREEMRYSWTVDDSPTRLTDYEIATLTTVNVKRVEDTTVKAEDMQP